MEVSFLSVTVRSDGAARWLAPLVILSTMALTAFIWLPVLRA